MLTPNTAKQATNAMTKDRAAMVTAGVDVRACEMISWMRHGLAVIRSSHIDHKIGLWSSWLSDPLSLRQ